MENMPSRHIFVDNVTIFERGIHKYKGTHQKQTKDDESALLCRNDKAQIDESYLFKSYMCI